MLKKDEFITFILDGQLESVGPLTAPQNNQSPSSDLMSFSFDVPEAAQSPHESGTSFAERLLVAADFGFPEMVQTEQLIRSTDAVAKYLPDRASFWPKTPVRPYQTLLFEADLSSGALLKIPAFKSNKVCHLNDVEAALARMVSEALEGFQKGGEAVKADVRQGKKHETLCIISVKDEREQQSVRLVCFGTVNAKTGSLETFHLTEQTRYWDAQLAKDHLGLLYERQFKKLGTVTWQEAFTTSEERERAEKLLKVCSKKSPSVKEIQENVLNLLDSIAKGFGLRKKPGHLLRLQAFDLPSDHDIGIDPKELTSIHGGRNPFGGVTLRDEKNRLLGYIVYPLKKKEDAEKLRSFLASNNRFHNVLVVFPDGDETTLELWQGTDQLSGRLRKGHGYKDAAEVVSLLSRFFVVSKAKVRNPSELAQELAYRARYLRRLAITELKAEKTDGPLRNLYKAFKETLIHDQTEIDFADAFAQTLTYGLLTARWIGNGKLAETGDRFTRQNALKYLPATSNFLKDLFVSALDVRLDEKRGRLLWLVDDIADLLDRIDVGYVFGIGDKDSDQATDPVIHFYEPFLAAYDNELRNKRGVYFTPRSVVSYIVLSVHQLLQSEFGLDDGLASTATWGDVQKKSPDMRLPGGVKESDAFVCILDPATGTGTFLYECITIIERTMKEKWCKQLDKKEWDDPAILSRWREYVPMHLLPRLYGFELMMASYSIAHLKLAFKLGETGYQFLRDDRLRVYLTNTLEPASFEQKKLVGVVPALAHEAEEVNEVKRENRFTVVVGNPPYSGISANMIEHSQRIIDAYKIVDGGALNERKLWLQDDYVKFIRTSQIVIEETGVGILGFITNHGYLDNPTFRGMRQSLIRTFQRLFVLDLHGNANKKEQTPDGSEDKNVFDIRQGVAVCLAACGIMPNSVKHMDLWGSRENKYAWLNSHAVDNTSFKSLDPDSPYYFLKPQNIDYRSEYDSGWKLTEIFPLNGVGAVTARDSLTINQKADDLWHVVNDFLSLPIEKARAKYNLGKDARDWRVETAQADLNNSGPCKKSVVPIMYRPFDFRYTYYTGKSRGFYASPCGKVMNQMLDGTNRALVAARSVEIGTYEHIFCTSRIIGHHSVSLKEVNYLFPLYVGMAKPEGGLDIEHARRPNLSEGFIQCIANLFNVKPKGKYSLPDGFTAEDIYHYVYAVLHCPTYRTRYAEFLKSDFPRVPLTSNIKLFRALTKLGAKLVPLHLLEAKINDFITNFAGNGDHSVLKKPTWKDDAVWINKTQRFEGVSENVWNFRIGGYQICEKWLKDRKGLTLSAEDIVHYQKIVVAINATIKLMTEIDEVIDSHGGWPAAFHTRPAGAR